MPRIYLAHAQLGTLNEHETGRKLLAQLYRQYVGGPMPEICIAPKGKPYFAGSPWHFSISHTKHYAFCVLSDCPVGIDAEELDRKIRLELAHKLLSAGELAQLEGSEDPQRTFLSFWVLKEATAKHTGEGIRIHPKHTDFVLPDSRIRQIGNCLVAVVY